MARSSPAVLVWAAELVSEKQPELAELAYQRVADEFGYSEWVEPALLALAASALTGLSASTSRACGVSAAKAVARKLGAGAQLVCERMTAVRRASSKHHPS